MRHCSQLDVNNSNCFACYSFVYVLFINNHNHWTIIRRRSSNAQHLHTKLTEIHSCNCFIFCYSPIYKVCINNNYSTDLYNGDLQTEITLFKRTGSSHKTLWTSLTHLAALSCLLYDRVNSQMNVLESKCCWLRLFEISVNLNNDFYIYYCSVVCVFGLH